jgi:hypothetical protein
MGLGSGIRDPGSRIRDPGSRIQGSKSTGSRIWIRNTACKYLIDRGPLTDRYLYLSPGGKNAVDEVEGGEDNHHEKHGVDGNIPVEIPAQKIAKVTILFS